MLDTTNTLKTLLANQYEASLCMLNASIVRCPESLWNAPVAKWKFCQVAFHTLFFDDYYLGEDRAGDASSMKQQPFHKENAPFFRDYEELQDRDPQLLYDRPAILRYLQYCRGKARDVIAASTAETLAAPCGFPRKTFSRAELLVYNMRHIHHHAAQLALRLRLDTPLDLPWVGSGWKEF